MEITSSLNERTPQANAASDPLLVLDGLVSTLQSVESAIASLQALREYTLAIASRVADVLAEEDMHDGGVRPGLNAAARWDTAELAQRAVAAEIAAATHTNDRTIQRQMGQAVELLDRFPLTFGALAHGRISLAHARVIQDAGSALEDLLPWLGTSLWWWPARSSRLPAGCGAWPCGRPKRPGPNP